METQTDRRQAIFRHLFFEYTFPVEGNGNIRVSVCVVDGEDFEYTFPFEGNGNSWIIRIFQPILRVDFEYTFPFEGNGNESTVAGASTGASSSFEYTFPFEGNGNVNLSTLLGVDQGCL